MILWRLLVRLTWCSWRGHVPWPDPAYVSEVQLAQAGGDRWCDRCGKTLQKRTPGVL